MTKLVFRVGVSREDIDREIVERVELAMDAAAHGEEIEALRSYDFENWNVFFKTLTPNRIALLEFISKHGGVASVRSLAAALERDYRAVHADVAGLLHLGLLHKDGTALHCESPAEATLIPA